MAWDYFRVGQFTANYRVSERLISTDTKTTTRYKVICTQCNQYSVVSHRTLERRLIKGTIGCKYCASTFAKKRRPIRPLDLFDVGAVFSNKKVLEILEDTGYAFSTLYRIENLCCGEDSVISHEGLRYYIAKGVAGTRCKHCTGRRPMKGVSTVHWPVPPSVLNDNDFWIWADRGGK